MMTARENYLIAARGGKPERVPLFPNDCNIFVTDIWDPDPETKLDFLGVKWSGNEYGAMPEEGYYAMKDISGWHDVKFPDLSKCDWDAMRDRFMETYDPDKVNIAMLNTHGLFLIPINMMGWTEGLATLAEEPEESKAFVDALADFMVEMVDYICEYGKPDIIFTGDDVANSNGPFISLNTWNEIFADAFRRVIDAIHKHGVLAEFHCCGNCDFLLEEFLKVGTDICQLPMPNQKLLEDKKRFGSRLVITGGWDRRGPGNLPGATELDVRDSVDLALDTYGKDGALIFWDGGVIGESEESKQKLEWITDEVEKYGKVIYDN